MAENEASKGSKHVSVACKVPNGLVLRVFKSRKEHQQVMGGGSREVEVNYQVGEGFKVNGPKPLSAQPNFAMPGGYALTHNVPADVWESWLKANEDSVMVKNKQIFAAATSEAAAKMAVEHEEVKSNLEPLDPATINVKGREVNVDPRWPKAVPMAPGGSGVTPIQTGARTG
jgi:hypothetical protein